MTEECGIPDPHFIDDFVDLSNEFVAKFKEDISSNISVSQYGFVVTGLPEIDSINQQYDVIEYESVFKVYNESDDIFHLKNIYKFTVENETDVSSVIQCYMESSNIVYAELNYIINISIVPNDPYFDLQWALNQSSDHDIDAPETWDIETRDERKIWQCGSFFVILMLEKRNYYRFKKSINPVSEIVPFSFDLT